MSLPCAPVTLSVEQLKQLERKLSAMRHDVNGSLSLVVAAVEMMCAGGTPVRLLATVVVPTDEVLYGLFAANSSEIVLQACKQAGIPAERLTAGVNARIPLER